MLRTGPELYPLREGLVNQPCFHPHRHSVANLQTAADEDNELRRSTSGTLLQENTVSTKMYSSENISFLINIYRIMISLRAYD